MKTVYCIICGLICSLYSIAQNVTSKEFNDLKRSNKYFYYEVNLEDRQKAREAAKANLIKLINDFYEKNAIDKDKLDENSIKDVLYIEMDRNGVMKVMAYVDKAKVTETNENDGRVESFAKNDPVDVVQKGTPNEGVIVSNHEYVIQDNNTTFPIASTPHLENWQEKVISDVCRITYANQIFSELANLKDKYKVKRFGVYGECNNASDCFWVMYDSSKSVVAVLGPGEDTRYDFLNKINITLESYTAKGLKGIWFQLAK